jgi:hypothetical protein
LIHAERRHRRRRAEALARKLGQPIGESGYEPSGIEYVDDAELV